MVLLEQEPITRFLKICIKNLIWLDIAWFDIAHMFLFIFLHWFKDTTRSGI